MMKFCLICAALLLAALPCEGQKSTGNAQTTGTCSPAISGNNDQVTINCRGMSKAQAEEMSSILNKILANQIDPATVMAKLDEILKAVNPNARITTYNCDGSQVRSTGPGINAASETRVTVGSDSLYQEMVKLYKTQHYSELAAFSLSEIESKPEWMTPRLFGSLAYLKLGETAKAKEMMKEFDSKAGPAYAVEPCQQMANFLHSHLQ